MRGWFRKWFGGGSPDGGAGDGARPPEESTPGDPEPSKRWWHEELPDWAGAMKTHERFVVFMDAVERYFTRRKIRVRISPEGTVAMPEGAALPGTLGLGNLMQSCALHEQDEWNGLVAAHFDTMARSHAQQAQFDAQIKEWSFAESRLRVRLWDKDDVPQLVQAVASDDVPGLMSALVVDLPEVIRSVKQEEAAGWGISERELFRIARDNVLREVQPEVRPQDPERPDGLLIIEADSFYTATAALDVERIAGLLGEHGVFVSMPVRNGFLAWRFDTLEDVRGLGPLVRATKMLFEDGPGSISTRVWWFNAGAWHEVGYESSPEQVAIIPPPELAEYLSRLAEEESE